MEADPDLLRSAVENVVRNATRYTAEGTTVEVRLERQQAATDGEEIVVRVLDSGPGVPDEALQKIFEPFYRLDDARNRQTGGAGLGLSIADRAIRLHGGQLRASNRKEGGLEVEIRIPAVRLSGVCSSRSFLIQKYISATSFSLRDGWQGIACDGAADTPISARAGDSRCRRK